MLLSSEEFFFEGFKGRKTISASDPTGHPGNESSKASSELDRILGSSSGVRECLIYKQVILVANLAGTVQIASLAHIMDFRGPHYRIIYAISFLAGIPFIGILTTRFYSSHYRQSC